jgi:hypothetical protein
MTLPRRLWRGGGARGDPKRRNLSQIAPSFGPELLVSSVRTGEGVMRFAVYLARLLAAGLRLAPALALIIAAAIVGAGLVVESGSSRLASATAQIDAQVAGLDRIDMLRAEHALIADFVNQRQEAQREANAAADDEVARVKVAMAEHAAAAQRVAMITPAESHTAPVSKLATAARKMASVTPRQTQSQAQAQTQAIAPPLSLMAMAEAVPPAPPRPNIVIRRVRDVVATVEQIPDWIQGAATWVVDLPGQALPRWPRRLNVSL